MQKNQSSKLPSAEAVRLEQLIDYSANSIVSREILKTKTGTLTLFAFDAGQGLSEHSAPFDAVVHVLDGQAEIMIGGKIVIAKAGETVLMPANVPHAVTAHQRFKMLLIMIRE
ncbi:MAG: cupin domain-containing protein [candidate division KSB1 bacterium]|nr:cupin domain-containing protein [candidate division KSB1 bacterium]MDZ7401277.1 cupin domain-containing protein [candidate division KSB1 bacterium]